MTEPVRWKLVGAIRAATRKDGVGPLAFAAAANPGF